MKIIIYTATKATEVALAKILKISASEAERMILDQGLKYKLDYDPDERNAQRNFVEAGQTLIVEEVIPFIAVTYTPFKSLESGEWRETPIAIIMHRTVTKSSADIDKTLFSTYRKASSVKGANFYVDASGIIYQTTSNWQYALHIWDSSKQLYPEYYGVLHNYNTVGIEVTGDYNDDTETWEPLTDMQIRSVKQLVERLMARYSISKQNVYPHEKVQRKTEGEGQFVLDAIGF